MGNAGEELLEWGQAESLGSLEKREKRQRGWGKGLLNRWFCRGLERRGHWSPVASIFSVKDKARLVQPLLAKVV